MGKDTKFGQIKDGRLHPKIPQDEPVFVLRAQDSVSVQTIRAYQMFCRQNPDVPEEHIEAVDESIENFEKWQKKNKKKVKAPD